MADADLSRFGTEDKADRSALLTALDFNAVRITLCGMDVDRNTDRATRDVEIIARHLERRATWHGAELLGETGFQELRAWAKGI